MFQLYAVQAAATPDGDTLSFEKEDGETESLSLGGYDTPEAALRALAQAHADRQTRPSYADPAVTPPLWGHELYQQPEGGRATCIARAADNKLTVTGQFASAASPGDKYHREQRCPLPPRWS